MKYLGIIFLVLIINTGICQSDTVFIKYNIGNYNKPIRYHIDTVVFDSQMGRNILTGTTILPGTWGQQMAKNYGLFFKEVTFTQCEGGRPDEIPVGIEMTRTDSTISFKCNIIGNCCHSFLCDIEIVEDSILTLKHHGYGQSYCACSCCFGLDYKFDIYQDVPSMIDQVKYVVIDEFPNSLKKIVKQQ